MELTTISFPTFMPSFNPTPLVPKSTCDIGPSGDSTKKAYIVFATLFAFMGIFLYIIRKGSKVVYQFSIFTMVFQLAVLGIDLISDLMYIVFLYIGKVIDKKDDGGSLSVTALATVLLVTRLVHPIQTAVIANSLMGRNFQDKYLKLMDKEHFVQFGKPHNHYNNLHYHHHYQ
jgi:hypothetical protein